MGTSITSAIAQAMKSCAPTFVIGRGRPSPAAPWSTTTTRCRFTLAAAVLRNRNSRNTGPRTESPPSRGAREDGIRRFRAKNARPRAPLVSRPRASHRASCVACAHHHEDCVRFGRRCTLAPLTDSQIAANHGLPHGNVRPRRLHAGDLARGALERRDRPAEGAAHRRHSLRRRELPGRDVSLRHRADPAGAEPRRLRGARGRGRDGVPRRAHHPKPRRGRALLRHPRHDGRALATSARARATAAPSRPTAASSRSASSRRAFAGRSPSRAIARSWPASRT